MEKVFPVSVHPIFGSFGSLRFAKCHIPVSACSSFWEENLVEVKFMNHWQRSALFSGQHISQGLSEWFSYNQMTMSSIANEVDGESIRASF